MTYMLAIDQSTSATKAVLFDSQGTAIDREAREHRQLYPAPGLVEHDAEEIWQNVLGVIGALARRRPQEVRAAVGLAIANQRETFVVFDRRTGRPLHNAIVWQCRRGDAICRELIDDGYEQLVRRTTGLRLDAYFSASKLNWLLQREPRLRSQVEAGEALFGTIDAYLVYRLTGGSVYATDPTNASRTLLYDIAALAWDGELCKAFSVPAGRLPEVRESSAHFGTTDAAGVLSTALPICGVMGDSQASLFAQRCFRAGMAKVTFGTGSSVLLNIGGDMPQTDCNSVIALARVIDGKPAYAAEGLINFSAATIAWLKDQLGLIADANDAQGLAESLDDNGGVYLVPAFGGLSMPYWSPTARAAIVGLSAHSSKAHVVRAGLESIAYQVRDVLELTRRDAGVTPHVIYADGAPTRNAWLMQFVADVADAEIVASESSDASAWGAAMAGLFGLGVYGSLDEFESLPRTARTFRPSMEAATVERLVAGWSSAVQRVL